MVMPEDGSFTHCASASFQKTFPLQTAELKISLRQIIITLSRQKTRHLKKHGKPVPLFAMPLDEYKLMTSTQQFAFEKEIEA
jgi:hypothetical protein